MSVACVYTWEWSQGDTVSIDVCVWGGAGNNRDIQGYSIIYTLLCLRGSDILIAHFGKMCYLF